MKNTLFAFLAMTVFPFAGLTAQEAAIADMDKTDPNTAIAAESAKDPTADLSRLTIDEKKKLIFEMINAGAVEELEQLLNSSVYYLKNESGETILTQAILNDDEKMVTLLVQNAVANYKNDAGETPLTLALKMGNTALAGILLTRAKPSLKNDHGEAPLFLAIDLPDLGLIQDLIDRGADPNRKSNGETPMAKAASQNQLKTVALLIRNGADPSRANDNEETPLYLALRGQHTVMTGVLLYKSKRPGKDANWQTPVGEPLLNLAAAQGNEQMVRLLLDHGADPNQVDFMENSGLNVAVDKGFDAIALLLLERGANPDHPNIMGTTPIMAAAQNGNDKLARLLMEQGANPDQRNFAGIAANDFGDFPYFLTDEALRESIIEVVEESGVNN